MCDAAAAAETVAVEALWYQVEVRPAPGKGLGAYAATAVPAGALVCSYHGETLTLQQVRERYGQGATGCNQTADYLFELRPASESQTGLYVDGANTDHPSRFINHAEAGNLIPSPAREPYERIDFYSARPIAAGEELCFDYGVRYWAARGDGPVAGSDTRLLEIRLRRGIGRLGPLLRTMQGVARSLPL